MEPTVSFNAEKQRLIRAVKEKKNAAAWAAFLHFERAHTTDWPRILTLHNNALKLASASPVDEHSLSLRIGRAEVLMHLNPVEAAAEFDKLLESVPAGPLRDRVQQAREASSRRRSSSSSAVEADAEAETLHERPAGGGGGSGNGSDSDDMTVDDANAPTIQALADNDMTHGGGPVVSFSRRASTRAHSRAGGAETTAAASSSAVKAVAPPPPPPATVTAADSRSSVQATAGATAPPFTAMSLPAAATATTSTSTTTAATTATSGSKPAADAGVKVEGRGRGEPRAASGTSAAGTSAAGTAAKSSLLSGGARPRIFGKAVRVPAAVSVPSRAARTNLSPVREKDGEGDTGGHSGSIEPPQSSPASSPKQQQSTSPRQGDAANAAAVDRRAIDYILDWKPKSSAAVQDAGGSAADADVVTFKTKAPPSMGSAHTPKQHAASVRQSESPRRSQCTTGSTARRSGGGGGDSGDGLASDVPCKTPSSSSGSRGATPAAVSGAPTPSVPAGTPSSAERFVVNGRQFQKLCEIGKGGSSKVYKVLALDTHEIFALKRIRLHRSDRSTIASYKDEIDILTSLRGHPNIIHIVDSLIDMESKQIFVVMESGEIVLTKWLQREQDKKRKADKLRADGAAGGGGDGSGSDDYSDDEPTTPLASCAVDANMLRMIWLQMVSAVQTIHDARIVHGDLKSANFVFVEGTLKLIDFGIAKTIGNDTTNIVRDSTVGTVNYMAPEAVTGTTGSRWKLGRASDVWSLGCILYQMVYGVTPFASITNVIRKMHAIVDPGHAIPFPPIQDLALLDVMKRCLQRNPADRPSITGAKGLLQHPFLHPERISGMLYPHLSSAAADDIEIACQETSAFLRRATAAVSAAAAAAATATATTTAVVTTTAAATACDVPAAATADAAAASSAAAAKTEVKPWQRCDVDKENVGAVSLKPKGLSLRPALAVTVPTGPVAGAKPASTPTPTTLAASLKQQLEAKAAAKKAWDADAFEAAQAARRKDESKPATAFEAMLLDKFKDVAREDRDDTVTGTWQ